MDDDRLTSLVVTDLLRNLEGRAAEVRKVYAICLWADDAYGDFLISVATESSFERQKAAFADRARRRAAQSSRHPLEHRGLGSVPRG